MNTLYTVQLYSNNILMQKIAVSAKDKGEAETLAIDFAELRGYDNVTFLECSRVCRTPDELVDWI